MATALLLVACVPDGQCEGTGGVIDECKAGWTLEECAEWDEEEVNGSRWRFTYESCESLGYTAECSDGSFLKPEDSGNCG